MSGQAPRTLDAGVGLSGREAPRAGLLRRLADRSGLDLAPRSRPAGSAVLPARAAAWAGPLALAGLILLFTLVCGRWMVALHEAGHAETRQDIASVNQAVWNTAHGRVLQATILYEGVRDHLEPVLLVHALAYALGGTLHTVLYLQAFLLSLGAIPFYALGRQRGGPALGTGLLAASYLLLPPLHRLVEKDYFRTDQLLFPVLALMAYAVTVRRHRLALGAAVLALCIRESGALAVVGLGVYWLGVERRVRAGLGLAAFGVLWIPAVSYVLLPALIGHPTPHADQVRGPSQLADQVAALWAVRWPVGAALAVVLLLLRRRWAALLAVPALAAFLFYRTDLRYVAPLFAVVWMGVADELTRWPRPERRRAALTMALGLFALANVALGSWRPPSDAGIRDARPLLARVPPGASVCAESRVLVHLSLREQVYQFNREHYFPGTTRGCLDAEYFLLNRSGRDPALVGRRAPADRAQALRAVEALGVDTVAESGSWVLWRRRTLMATQPGPPPVRPPDGGPDQG
jgi:hypothetical protein